MIRLIIMFLNCRGRTRKATGVSKSTYARIKKEAFGIKRGSPRQYRPREKRYYIYKIA